MVVREEFKGPVFQEEVSGIIREEFKGPIFCEEVRAIVKEELNAAVQEMKRWLKVYSENISAEVRGGFKDQASVLKDKDRELEGRIVVLEQRAGIAAPTPS